MRFGVFGDFGDFGDFGRDMSLYAFTSHTFTNADKTGRTGPTITEVKAAYSTQTWAQNSDYLSMTSAVGIQRWKVPATGTYEIIAAGAQGGTSVTVGGKGAKMIGTFSLTQGEIISILVGQEGGVNSTGCNAGGGGGSFVWMTGDSTLLIAAGGGGGGGHGGGGGGHGGTTSNNGTGAFGTSTAGTSGNGATPGGSGWLSNGTSGLDGNNAGCQAPLNGGAGGYPLSSNDTTVGDGGFGGGASASGQGCSNGGPGGGGGYSGGAGPSGDTTAGIAGGGGSYNAGTAQSNTSGANTGHGYVTITRSQITATLTASTPIFYQKFVSNASISFDVITSNAVSVSRTHESNDNAVVTIPSSGSPSASIAGPGKTTIKVTQPATTTYTEVIENALITIIVIGQGKTYTSETFPSSFDLAGTNLSGSVFNSCNLTGADLYNTTVNASTSFSTSTLNSLKSGRITGVTSLLPAGYIMI